MIAQRARSYAASMTWSGVLLLRSPLPGTRSPGCSRLSFVQRRTYAWAT